MDKGFLPWLKQTVTLKPRTGLDRNGQPVFDPNPANWKTFPCYISNRTRMVRNLLGQEIVARHTIFLDGTPDTALLSVGDRLTGEGSADLPILEIRKRYDEKGNLHHVEVYL